LHDRTNQYRFGPTVADNILITVPSLLLLSPLLLQLSTGIMNINEISQQAYCGPSCGRVGKLQLHVGFDLSLSRDLSISNSQDGCRRYDGVVDSVLERVQFG